MPLRGIDVSSHQAGIDIAAVPADFVIVKATGGTSYANPEFRRQADAAIAAGRKLGVYHYAREDSCPGDASTEAAHFLNAFAPYKGRAIPILDWEGSATSMPVEWAASWLRAVERDTKARPWFYSYSSYVNDADCSKLAEWPLWIAAYYADYEPMGYQQNPPLYGGTGAWSHPTAYQYTSTGRLDGYGGNLDLNVFYGDGEDWDAMCGKSKAKRLVRCDQVAAGTHNRMVADDRFGYSWEERWGHAPEQWEVDGVSFEMMVGDYDCSSSPITAWRKALKGTPYEHSLDGATYTGNMRAIFTASGLFEWKPVDFPAQPGDLYLNEANHVAMYQGDGKLSEFCWGDNGAYGNRRGDQSGNEARISSMYSYPWDGVLHYNGKADYYIEGEEEEDMPFAFLCQPDDRDEMWFFDGSVIHRLNHPDQMKAIQDAYRKTTGKDMPCFELGSKNAPWAARFAQAFEVRNARDGSLGDEYKVVG